MCEQSLNRNLTEGKKKAGNVAYGKSPTCLIVENWCLFSVHSYGVRPDIVMYLAKV